MIRQHAKTLMMKMSSKEALRKGIDRTGIQRKVNAYVSILLFGKRSGLRGGGSVDHHTNNDAGRLATQDVTAVSSSTAAEYFVIVAGLSSIPSAAHPISAAPYFCLNGQLKPHHPVSIDDRSRQTMHNHPFLMTI